MTMEMHESEPEMNPVGHDDKPTPGRLDIHHVMRVKDEYEEQLLKLPDVVGVGIGFRAIEGRQTGELALIVSVRRKLTPSGQVQDLDIPKELDGVPVDVKEVGDVSAY